MAIEADFQVNARQTKLVRNGITLWATSKPMGGCGKCVFRGTPECVIVPCMPWERNDGAKVTWVQDDDS